MHTRRKLDEAKFFLAHADKARHAREFNFYLSACISAARSVAWIMRSEYCRVIGWEAWFQGKVPSEDERKLMRQINEIRVRSEKKEALRARATLEVNIPPEHISSDLKESMKTWAAGSRFKLALLEISDTGEMKMPDGFPEDAIVGTVEAFELRLEELPEEDVLVALGRYITQLGSLVDECEARFVL